MAFIKFINDESQYDVIAVTKSNYSDNAVRVLFADYAPSIVGGFKYYLPPRTRVMGDYSEYKYIFKNDEAGVVEFSTVDETYVEPVRDITIAVSWNDNENEDLIRPNSVKVKATPSKGASKTYTLSASNDWKQTLNDIPTEITYKVDPVDVDGYEVNSYSTSVNYSHTPIRVVRENKITELNAKATEMINDGATVELLDGTTRKFNYSTYSQMNLAAAYSSASTLMSIGQINEKVPYYTSDNKCELYYPVEIAKIYLAMGLLLTNSLTLAHQLEQMIDTMTDANAINEITLSVDCLDADHLMEFNTILGQTQNIINIISQALMPTE